MAFWEADFSTRMGAETATGQGGLACFIKAGFMVLGAAVFGGMAGFETTEGQVIVAALGLQLVLFVIAGFRFRAGKGAFWGIVAAALLALAIVDSLVTMAFGGIIINAVFLVVVVQGVRGAFALRKGEFDEDDIEAFE